MKPVRGEKPPLRSISRSQIWRGVRSQEGKSRDSALVAAAWSRSRMRLMSSPPCGGTRWLWVVDVFKGMDVMIVDCLLLASEGSNGRRSRPTCEPSGGSAGVHPRVKRPHVQSGLLRERLSCRCGVRLARLGRSRRAQFLHSESQATRSRVQARPARLGPNQRKSMDYLIAITAASFIAAYALIVWQRLPKQ